MIEFPIPELSQYADQRELVTISDVIDPGAMVLNPDTRQKQANSSQRPEDPFLWRLRSVAKPTAPGLRSPRTSDDVRPRRVAYKALRAGASGFVLKDIPPEQLVTAVRTVADGGALLAPSITRRLIGQFAQRLAVDTAVSGRLERLTDREREVLAAIARGSSNAEISEELFIGAATVKSHVSSILTKLGLRDRAQAVVFAYESGLAEAGDHNIGH